jgi:hypothetical protein
MGTYVQLVFGLLEAVDENQQQVATRELKNMTWALTFKNEEERAYFREALEETTGVTSVKIMINRLKDLVNELEELEREMGINEIPDEVVLEDNEDLQLANCEENIIEDQDIVILPDEVVLEDNEDLQLANCEENIIEDQDIVILPDEKEELVENRSTTSEAVRGRISKSNDKKKKSGNDIVKEDYSHDKSTAKENGKRKCIYIDDEAIEVKEREPKRRKEDLRKEKINEFCKELQGEKNKENAKELSGKVEGQRVGIERIAYLMDKTERSNARGVLIWHEGGQEIREEIDRRANQRETEKTVKGKIYKELERKFHEWGYHRTESTIRNKVRKMMKIYELFAEIGEWRIDNCKNFSADWIARLEDEELEEIRAFFRLEK